MTNKYNSEIDSENLICPYCEAKNDSTDFIADGFLEGETDCVKCEKVFKFSIEFNPTHSTWTIEDD